MWSYDKSQHAREELVKPLTVASLAGTIFNVIMHAGQCVCKCVYLSYK